MIAPRRTALKVAGDCINHSHDVVQVRRDHVLLYAAFHLVATAAFLSLWPPVRGSLVVLRPPIFFKSGVCNLPSTVSVISFVLQSQPNGCLIFTPRTFT